MNSPTSNPIQDLLNAYASAVLAKDVDAFVALYADDSQIFDAWDRWRYDRKQDWRAMASGWFSSLGIERVVVEITDLQTQHLGELACGHAAVAYTAIAPDGTRLRSMGNRMTLVARRSDAGWQIVHEHTSVPVDFKTKAVVGS